MSKAEKNYETKLILKLKYLDCSPEQDHPEQPPGHYILIESKNKIAAIYIPDEFKILFPAWSIWEIEDF